MFGLFNIIITYVLEIFDHLAGIPNIPYYIYALAVLTPALAVGVRRMHDTDHSGWWLLFPLVNLLFAVRAGQRGGNRFGSDPKAAI